VRAKVVLDATAEYFSEQDTFRQWIEDCCETGARTLSETTRNLWLSVGGPNSKCDRRPANGPSRAGIVRYKRRIADER
jgi:phage/plasmid-associated DNA primase